MSKFFNPGHTFNNMPIKFTSDASQKLLFLHQAVNAIIDKNIEAAKLVKQQPLKDEEPEIIINYEDHNKTQNEPQTEAQIESETAAHFCEHIEAAFEKINEVQNDEHNDVNYEPQIIEEMTQLIEAENIPGIQTENMPSIQTEIIPAKCLPVEELYSCEPINPLAPQVENPMRLGYVEPAVQINVKAPAKHRFASLVVNLKNSLGCAKWYNLLNQSQLLRHRWNILLRANK